MTDYALHAESLCKAFGSTIAVNHLTLAIPTGVMYGLVGPNGAGKTTAMSMACGLLRPDAGTVSVLGHDVWSDPLAAKARLGVMPDGLRLFDRMNGHELVTHSGRLHGLDADVAAARADELLTVLGLSDAGTKLVCDYSAGMTKKVTLATALVHSPALLMLDEPFEAVDPVSAETIRTILRSYVERGGTVILSSHVMELVETLCTHVGIIHHGTVLCQGTTDEVRQGSSLQQRFVDLVGGPGEVGELSWLSN